MVSPVHFSFDKLVTHSIVFRGVLWLLISFMFLAGAILAALVAFKEDGTE